MPDHRRASHPSTDPVENRIPDPLGEIDPAFHPNGAAPLEEGPDPFNVESLRLPPDYATALGVKKALLTIPVKKPGKEWFVRVHPEADYQLESMFIELKESNELYLVHPSLRDLLEGEGTLTKQTIFLAINRQGTVFFWPVRMPGPDGRVSSWSKSALEAAHLATRSWVRVVANQSLGAYNVWQADFPLSEPDWPDVGMNALLRIAFKDFFIHSWDHPILRQLRGEV
jgi:hypothetical protein